MAKRLKKQKKIKTKVLKRKKRKLDKKVALFESAVSNFSAVRNNSQSETNQQPSLEPNIEKIDIKSAQTAAVNRMQHPKNITPIQNQMAAHATVLFSLAAGLGMVLIFSALYLPEGLKAVRAMSGFPQEGIPVRTAQVFIALDTLFPAFLLAGFAALATALQLHSNRPLVTLVLVSLLVALLSDMVENALVFDFIKSREPSDLQFPLTVVKFGSVAFAGVLVSVILPRIGKLVKLVNALLRYGLPIAAAVMVTQLGDPGIRDAFGAALVATILLLAFYSQRLTESD